MPKDTTGIKWCTGLSGEITSLAKVSDAQHARIVYSGDSSSDTSKQVPHLCDNSENTSKCSEFSISPDDMDILSNILESGTDTGKNEALNVLNTVSKRYIDVVVDKKKCAPYFYMNSEGPSLQEARGKNNVCIDNQCTSYAIGSDSASPTEIKSTEGCGWWGRGVIQTTGPCNFGKLNAALQSIDKYKDKFNLCKTPDLICNTKKWPELKWIAGFSYWLTDVQSHAGGADQDTDPSWDIADKIKNIDISDTNIYSTLDTRIEVESSANNSFNLFVDATSGLVNRGCAKTTCAAGDVHNVKERRKNAIIVKNNLLKAVNMQSPPNTILELLSNSTSLSDDFTKNILQTLSPGIVQVYTYDAFKSALKIVIAKTAGGEGGIDGEIFYTGTDLNTSIINISAFLGQCMQETIQYGACDENNWSSGYADRCAGGTCGTSHCPYLSVVQIANNMCSCKESIGFTKYPDCTKTTCTTPVNEDECKTKSSCKWYYDKTTDTSSCVQNIYGNTPSAPNEMPRDTAGEYTAVSDYTFYPNTSSCGQLGQDYKNYSCAASPDGCDTTFIDKRIMIATTHAQYYGAAPPLYSDVMGGTIGKQYWDGTAE